MYQVKVYLKTNAIETYPAYDLRNAREIAARITREGLWTINANGTEEYYPTDAIYKAKILPPGYDEPQND